MTKLISETIMEKRFNANKAGNILKGLANGTASYPSEEVDVFLDQISVQVEGLERENETLKQENRQLRQRENVATGMPIELTPVEEQAKNDYFKKLGEFEQLEKIYKISIHGAHKEITKHVTEVKEKAENEAADIIREANEKAIEITTKANALWEERSGEIRQMEEQMQVMKEHFQLAFQKMNETNK